MPLGVDVVTWGSVEIGITHPFIRGESLGTSEVLLSTG